MRKIGTRSLKKKEGPKKNPNHKVTEEMLNHIRDEKNIFGWSTLNLKERVVMLHRVYPEKKISGAYLGQIYKKYGISVKMVK